MLPRAASRPISSACHCRGSFSTSRFCAAARSEPSELSRVSPPSRMGSPRTSVRVAAPSPGFLGFAASTKLLKASVRLSPSSARRTAARREVGVAPSRGACTNACTAGAASRQARGTTPIRVGGGFSQHERLSWGRGHTHRSADTYTQEKRTVTGCFDVNRFLSWLAKLDHSHCNSADPPTDGSEVSAALFASLLIAANGPSSQPGR